MAIILPDGVLFRGGVLERIRTELLKDGHIGTVIVLRGISFLPAGIWSLPPGIGSLPTGDFLPSGGPMTLGLDVNQAPTLHGLDCSLPCDKRFRFRSRRQTDANHSR